jgi:hypothetical protein
MTVREFMKLFCDYGWADPVTAVGDTEIVYYSTDMLKSVYRARRLYTWGHVATMKRHSLVIWTPDPDRDTDVSQNWKYTEFSLSGMDTPISELQEQSGWRSVTKLLEFLDMKEPENDEYVDLDNIVF